MDSLGTLTGGVVMMLAVIAMAAGIARRGKFYRRELAASANRELALDGLRGMAALMVATHHAVLCCTWLKTGNWGEAQSPVLQLFAPAGVIIFSCSRVVCSGAKPAPETEKWTCGNYGAADCIASPRCICSAF